MSWWGKQELPPLQKMPRTRKPADAKPGVFRRALGGVAGLALGVTSAVSLMNALQDTTGRSSPFMALALLLPTAILIRYALTGKIKVS